MNVLVVTGGLGDEKKVSLKSAENVSEALRKRNYHVELFDLAAGPEQLAAAVRLSMPDVIFPIIHGPEGEDGRLQELLERIGIPFVGSGSRACHDGWDKFAFKEFCAKAGIKTPVWKELTRDNINSIQEYPVPFVVKPSNNGSSVDVFIIKNRNEIQDINLPALVDKYQRILLEEYIPGIEVTAGILGNTVLPIVEIRPPTGSWFNYENKYNGRTKEIAPARSLSPEQVRATKELAWKIHHDLGCRHYSRIDFIINESRVYPLELNTIPGLTSESLLPKAAQSAGISFPEMVDRMVRMAKAV